MQFLLDLNNRLITPNTYSLYSLDTVMPGHSPLKLGAPTNASDGERNSLMLAQHENLAIYSTSIQNQRADICRVIQDRYVNIDAVFICFVFVFGFCFMDSSKPSDGRPSTSPIKVSTSLLYMRVRKHLASFEHTFEN